MRRQRQRRLAIARKVNPGMHLVLGLMLAAGLLLLPPVPAQATGRVIAADDKPDEIGLVHVRSVFDCTGRDTLSLAPGQTIGLSGDTSDGTNQLPSYSCRLWSEAGPEHIYRLEVGSDLELTASLGDLGDNDLDLFLLEGCDSDLCLVGANAELRAELTAGTYYLVVDGYGTSAPAAGTYTLNLETRWNGLPDAACAAGDAAPVTCDGTLISDTGDLFGMPDLIQHDGCSSSSLIRGGERWYALTLPGVHEVTVTTTTAVISLDQVLWLFDGCGPDAECLGFADEKIGGQGETLAFVNEGDTPRTVYLAVDAIRPAAAEGQGDFAIEFACQSNVAAEMTSFGSLRAMYR